ncbi:uncharacterized protein LOC123471071 [Daphnia magna]|uniref:uncharacterized protein LOC123471071 n=1 Tax=Daphnia magna TaxID=35525 RepID=UPI001E1BC15B|nr:uncharacterized protein LOC123471071 [Daphnia magna]
MSVDVEPSTSKDDRRRRTPTIDLTESQPALAEKKNYVVFVPPDYFEKVSSIEKSTIYKCLMGCLNKTVTVNTTTLHNVRRHVEVDLHLNALYFLQLLPDLNSKIEEHKTQSLLNKRRDSGKDVFGAQTVIDKHLVNTKESPTSKPIVTQADLDDKITDFIVSDMNALRIVEKEGFLGLMGGLVGKLKVDVMITDSGSNFFKAFKVFGGNELTEDQDDLQNYDDEDCENDDDVVYIDLDQIFQEHAQEQILVENEDADSETENECRERIKLPYHVKCPCDLLNLIATTDISKITNVTFNKLKKQVRFSSCTIKLDGMLSTTP